jgi:hypothetical protein
MTDERPLPADIKTWPENPFELLGATPTTDAKTLKRAYQRLIRFYRPEEFPEEFRRVREAYETASSFAQMLAQSGVETVVTGDMPGLATETPPSNGSPDSAPAPSSDPGRPPDASAAAPADPAGPPTSDDDARFDARLAAAWEAARRSAFDEAYRLAKELGAEYPERVRPYLAKYWLLRLNGKLDPGRKPCDELCDCLFGVKAGRPAALELYRRELERTPEEALSERSTRVLREVLGDGPAFVVAHPRWQEASRRGRWDVIQEDLNALRTAPISYDRETWIRLLWSACEACLFAEGGFGFSIYAACIHEMEQAADAVLTQQGALSQFDFFVEVTKQIRKLRTRNVPVAFNRIVAHSWSTSPGDLYLQIVSFIAPWIENQGPLIRLLTDVRTEGSAVLGRFAEILIFVGREIGRSVESFWTPDAAFSVAAEFVAGSMWRSYDTPFRTSLVRFCLYQRMTPMEFAEAMIREPSYATADGHLAELVASDLPLHCAYEALRLLDG